MVILDSTTVHLCNQSFHNTYYHPDPSYSYQCQPNSSFTANNKSLSVAHANSTNRNSFFTDLTTLIFRQVQKNIPQKVRILHLPCFKIFTTMSSSATSSSPEVEYSELDTKEGKAWNAACSPEIYDEGYIALGSTRGVFARSYLTYYNRIKSFPIRDDDVWIVSFPKTGTTWTQEMVWCIMNDLDFQGAKSDMGKRCPYFEVRANWSPRLASIIQRGVVENMEVDSESKNFFQDSFTLTETLPSARCVKSHLHFSLLPTQLIEGSTKAKMVYVARDPKDTCISFRFCPQFHHSCLLDGYSASLEEFVEQFISDNVFCAPFWTHVREFWERKDRGDILFLTYEEMQKDLPAVILNTARFLGKTLTPEQVTELAEHLSFKNMKVNPFVNQECVVENLRKIHGRTHNSQFMRKGKVGSWKEELSPETVAKMDAWIEANKIEGLF